MDTTGLLHIVIVLCAVILLMVVINFTMLVYHVTRTFDTAKALAVDLAAAQRDVLGHLQRNTAVSTQAADAATDAYHEANQVNQKIAVIARSTQVAVQADADARADVLSSIAVTGEVTNRDVKEVKSAVVRAEGAAASAATDAANAAEDRRRP